MLSMYFFSKLNQITVAMCSGTFAQKMALIKWMLASPCERQDSQRKWWKHGCRSRSANVYTFFWHPLYTRCFKRNSKYFRSW